jgi:hypothetical protein
MTLPPPHITTGGAKKAEESIVERFKGLGLLTIVSAGLIDGINPCAFATLIFFVSYLAFIGRKKKEVLWVGMGFSGAVFITYLLIGFESFLSSSTSHSCPLFSHRLSSHHPHRPDLRILSLYDYIQLKRDVPRR